VRELLTQQGITTVFLPLPGLTTQFADTDQPWQLQDYVDWVATQLPDRAVILLGHSFGGQLAVRFTAQHSTRVEALILIDSSGIRDHSVRATIKRAVFWVAAKIGKVFRGIPGARKLLYRLAREQDYYQASPVMQKTMANVIAEEIIADLSQVAVPTLLLWGEADQATPVRNIEYFRVIPELEVQTIPEARHSPQFTHPQVVATAVTAFLEELATK